MAVPNNLSMSGLVANLSMGIDPIGILGFDRLGQQSLGTFSENAAQHILSLGEWQDSCVNATIAHGGVLLCLVGNWVKRTFTPRVRRLFSFDHQQLSVIPHFGFGVVLSDLTLGKDNCRVGPLDAAVRSLAFAPDGKTLASGHYDSI